MPWVGDVSESVENLIYYNVYYLNTFSLHSTIYCFEVLMQLFRYSFDALKYQDFRTRQIIDSWRWIILYTSGSQDSRDLKSEMLLKFLPLFHPLSVGYQSEA